jgi:capsular polysaccharide export protein
MEILKSVLKMDGKISSNKITALLEVGEKDTALEILERFPSNILGNAFNFLAVEVLIDNDRLHDALNFADRLRVQQPSYQSYRANLKVLILLGKFHDALKVIKEAESKNIDVGEMLKRKVLFDLGFIEDAFRLYRESKFQKTLVDYFGAKYFDKNFNCADDLLIVPIFGPGDELRWASIYNDLYNLLPKHSWQIGCDPRFEKIFKRSMPNISFVPIQRLRGTEKIKEGTHDQLPSRFLTNVLDNEAYNLVQRKNQFAVVPDFLPLVRKTKTDFDGGSYLITDPDRSYRQMLTNKFPGKILVGINWRSSLHGRSRSVHYLSIDMLFPLFALDGVQFVNLQYDECSAELALVDSTLPGKIWNDERLDQRNDLDGVAALMDGLDLVIAPCTSVLELAGALGKKAWLISLSPEMNWRKSDFNKDLWFESIEHIQGKTASNKSDVVDALTSRLQKFLDESRK